MKNVFQSISVLILLHVNNLHKHKTGNKTHKTRRTDIFNTNNKKYLYSIKMYT